MGGRGSSVVGHVRMQSSTGDNPLDHEDALGLQPWHADGLVFHKRSEVGVPATRRLTEAEQQHQTATDHRNPESGMPPSFSRES